MNTTELLQQAHAELWAFRAEMGDAWPTPDTLDALRFAVTEAGEALDAWMRANRPQYARNRERLNGEDAVLDELADCAMMLLTAAGRTSGNIDFLKWAFDWDIDNIVSRVTDLLNMFLSGGQHNGDWEVCMWTVWGIANYPGMDLLPRLRSRYARIRAKQRRVRLVEVDGLIGGVPSNGYDLEDHVIEPGVIHYGTDML